MASTLKRSQGSTLKNYATRNSWALTCMMAIMAAPISLASSSSTTQTPTLQPPFTLQYAVTETIYTPDQQVGKQYTFNVTLSASGSKLLYIKKGAGTDDVTMLYDGQNTYLIDSNIISPPGEQMVHCLPGLSNINNLYSLPLPGMGIPNIPLFTNLQDRSMSTGPSSQVDGQTPGFFRPPSPHLGFTPSTATYVSGGSGEIATLLLPKGADVKGPILPFEGWDFSGYKTFSGQRIASLIVYTQYTRRSTPTGLEAFPAGTFSYQQIAADPVALDPLSFDYVHYLHNGDLINDDLDNVSFSYSSTSPMSDLIKRAAFLRDQVNYEKQEKVPTLSRSTGAVGTVSPALLGDATSSNAQVALSPHRADLVGKVFDASGSAVSAATVYMYTAEPRQGVSIYCPSCYSDCGKQAVTDKNGSFRIRGLDPSLIFQVLVVRDGYDSQITDSVDPIKGHVALTVSRQNNAPDSAHTIGGIIVDSYGKPVIGATVEPVDLSTPTGGAVGGTVLGNDPIKISNDKGAFGFTCPDPADKIWVLIKARGLAPKIAADLEAGKSRTITMSEGSTISGTVITSSGKPVANAVVEIVQQDLEVERLFGIFEIATDADGRFTLPNVPSSAPPGSIGDPPGVTYTICVRMDSLGNSNLGSQRKLIEIDPSDSLVKFEPIVLSSASRIEGQVKLSDGKPLPAGCRVMLGRDATWDVQQALLPPTGKFLFNNVPFDDDFGITVRVPGYDMSSIDKIRLSLSMPTKDVEIVMTPSNHP